MYKVIVAMMIMAITTAPVFAASNVDRNARPHKKEMRMTAHKYDKNHKRHAPAIQVLSFKVSHKASKKRNFVTKVGAIHGVKDVNWNPRTSVMTVTYDPRKTSARTIKAAVR